VARAVRIAAGGNLETRAGRGVVDRSEQLAVAGRVAGSNVVGGVVERIGGLQQRDRASAVLDVPHVDRVLGVTVLLASRQLERGAADGGVNQCWRETERGVVAAQAAQRHGVPPEYMVAGVVADSVAWLRAGAVDRARLAARGQSGRLRVGFEATGAGRVGTLAQARFE